MWGYVSQVKTISGQALRLGQVRGPSAAALYMKKYNNNRYVGLG